jgi:hypothetical protein
MGQELPESQAQPLQSVRITRKGTIALAAASVRALGFSAGDGLTLDLHNGRCRLRACKRGGVTFEGGRSVTLTLTAKVAGHLSSSGAAGLALVRRGGEGTVLPVLVREHAPDLLGPRIVDEVRDADIVRHAIPGPSREGWTAKALRQLEEILCAEPFDMDPVPAIGEGNDWVAWMTRNRILGRPAPGDDHVSDGLIAEIASQQCDDGSWGAVPATAYAMLGVLALGAAPSERGLRRAAGWLLDRPEPPPRPGMWMLNQDYLDQWLSCRQPKETRTFAPCDFQWTPPDEETNFFSWDFPEHEQDQFRAQPFQRFIPTCARHHAPACEPRITHVSAVVGAALLRSGCADHPRLRRYVNTVFHLGGEWGYWCGCGALGLYDSDIPSSESTPNFNVRAAAHDGRADLSTWRWISEAAESALLANRLAQRDQGSRGTHLQPFLWRDLPNANHRFALLGTAWQNGDCWAKTNRALSHHPSWPGSVSERLAIYQASRYQTSLGEWDQGFPAGMLAFLSLCNDPVAESLTIKTVPWLRSHQADDGLWHHDSLPRTGQGRLADPPEPRLATYHILAALHKFGLLDRLRQR